MPIYRQPLMAMAGNSNVSVYSARSDSIREDVVEYD